MPPYIKNFYLIIYFYIYLIISNIIGCVINHYVFYYKIYNYTLHENKNNLFVSQQKTIHLMSFL